MDLAKADVVHDFTFLPRKIVEVTVGRRLSGTTEGHQADPAIRAILGRNNLRAAVRLTGLPRTEVKKALIAAGEACASHHDTLAGKARAAAIDWRVFPTFPSSAPTIPYIDTWTAVDTRTRFVLCWRVCPHDLSTTRRLLRETSLFGPENVRFIAGRTQVVWRPVEGDSVTDVENLMARRFRMPDSREGISIGTGLAIKIRRHDALLALLFTFHNFATANAKGRSPAMEARLADRVYTIGEICSDSGPQAQSGQSENLSLS